jgi:hypothetical protein
MSACASCGEVRDVHLFESRCGEQSTRQWSCQPCAWERRHEGLEWELVAAWIERAARRELPGKDLRMLLSDQRWHERRHLADRRGTFG